MSFLPLSLNLANKQCLLVGGGNVAHRKLQSLLKTSADITVIAPDVSAHIKSTADISVHQRAFEDDDLLDVYLVIAATNNAELNAHIAELAKQNNILCNIADNAQASSVIFSATVDRAPLKIAISSGGKAPALLRLLRSQLQGVLPQYYSSLAKIFEDKRDLVKQSLPKLKDQRLFWKQLFQGKTLQYLQAEDYPKIEKIFAQSLATAKQQVDEQGFLFGSVALVGAGPGDPELLTLKAIRLIQWADVILYDRLVSPHILGYADDKAERVYVGKKRDYHSVPQDEINQLLIQYAKQGKQVLRLKGGDPFVFGRGGEEIAELCEAGIRFEVVPGVSSANGCAAYAGIPLTHRDYAQSVSFMPGYSKNGECQINWQNCLDANTTLVIFMGSKSLDEICSQLIAHGRDKQTPIAIVQQGTNAQQKVYNGELHNFAEKMRQQNLIAPTLIIIGDVVKLSSKLNWFNS